MNNIVSFIKEAKAFILMEGSLDSLKEILVNESDLRNTMWQRIGIGVKTNQWSTLYLTVIYSN